MRIGTDFPKIEFEFLGLQLLEPMALVSNTLMGAVSLFYWYRLKSLPATANTSLWKNFFLIFGLAALFGGLSHIFYNYWGLYGKIAPWGLTIISIYFAEVGILKPFGNTHIMRALHIGFVLKLILALILTFTYWNFLIVTANTIAGLLLFVCPMSIVLQRRNENYKYFWIGVLALLPAAAVYLLKINLHPWVNKDDLSHLFIIGCIFFFYKGVMRTQRIYTLKK